MLFSNVRSWMIGVALMALATAASANTRVEVSMITDWETVSYFASLSETKKFLDSTIAATSVLYREQLGIELIVTHVEIPADANADKLPKHTNADFLLESLKAYRVDNPAHRAADVTVLLSVRKLSIGSKKIGGYASLGSICSATSSAIVALKNDGLDYQTLAHEVAHTLGAQHDGESPCEKEDATGWLMSPISGGQQHFSECSIDTIKREIASFGDCLESKPANAASSIASGSATPASSMGASSGSSGGGAGSMDWVVAAGLLALMGVRRVSKQQLRRAVQSCERVAVAVRSAVMIGLI